MIDISLFLSALSFVFSVIGFLLVYSFVLTPTLTEKYRDNIFRIRRNLFLFMAEGNISPNHKAYIILRTTMNGSLQFSERLSLLRILTSAVLGRKLTREFNQTKTDAFNSIENEEVRKVLESYFQQIGVEMIKHLIFTSPVLSILTLSLVVIMIPVFLCFRTFQSVKEITNKIISFSTTFNPLNFLGAEAMAVGE